mmetsp:Transcript_28921/g.72101  ORF Transcript_28921/g.72101 Transcript_28921/m.72101 type:complete len:241 (-) Transcript_28921:514-1236(-)
MDAHRAAIPLLEPRRRAEVEREARGAARGHPLPHRAVRRARPVDCGARGPPRHAEVHARATRGLYADCRRVAEWVRRLDAHAAAGGEARLGGRVHAHHHPAVRSGVHQRVCKLRPPLVEVGGAAAEVGLEAVRLAQIVVVLPHVRVGLHRVDLIHRLQVLVGPHVPPSGGGPRRGQGVERDPLHPVGEGYLAVHRVHSLVRVHGLHHSTELNPARRRARIRHRSDLVADVHSRWQAVRGV